MGEALGRQRKLAHRWGDPEDTEQPGSTDREGELFPADLPLVPPPPHPQVLFLLHPALLLPISSPPLLHLHPLLSLAPLHAKALPLAEPLGLVFGECGECRITQATSAARGEARRPRRPGRSQQGKGAEPGPYLRRSFPPPPSPPCSTGSCSHARHRPGMGPLPSWPHWLLRAMGSPVSVLSSLFLN